MHKSKCKCVSSASCVFILTDLSCVSVLHPAGASCPPNVGQFIQTEACGSAPLNSVMAKTGAVNTITIFIFILYLLILNIYLQILIHLFTDNLYI